MSCRKRFLCDKVFVKIKSFEVKVRNGDCYEFGKTVGEHCKGNL